MEPYFLNCPRRRNTNRISVSMKKYSLTQFLFHFVSLAKFSPIYLVRRYLNGQGTELSENADIAQLI
jgi:hypothetical protein